MPKSVSTALAALLLVPVGCHAAGPAMNTGGEGGSVSSVSSGGSGGAPSSSGSTGGSVPVQPCPGLSVGVWENITPPEFATPANMETFSIAVNPLDLSVLSTAGNKTNGGTGSVGIFKSTDCGASWTKISTGKNGSVLETGESFGLMIDPVHPENVYTANGYGDGPTLYKSTNGGVDWDALQPDVQGVTSLSFVQTFDIDPKDANHIVLTFHENCNAPLAPMCFSETKDGGATWRELLGPDDGWHEAATIVMLGGPSWFFEDVNGAWLTVDGGQTWDKVLTAYGGFSNGPFYGGHLGPDGTLYVGVANTGIAASRADPTASPPVPLGKTWNLLPKTPQATAIVDDGVSMFIEWNWDTSGQPVYTASLGDLGTWTNLMTPAGGMKRGGNLAYEAGHHILYSGNGTSGLWRYKTR
jgi:hypothetical protein